MVNYVRALPSIDDFDKIATDVFGPDKEAKMRKLRDSVKYYQSGARDGYAKLKPTIVAAKKKVGDNIKMACEENCDNEVSASYQQQNGKKEKAKKKQQKKKDSAGGSSGTTEANLVERIALDLDELDLADMSELVNNSGSDDDKAKKSSVVQALAAGVEVTPSEAGKVNIQHYRTLIRKETGSFSLIRAKRALVSNYC